MTVGELRKLLAPFDEDCKILLATGLETIRIQGCSEMSMEFFHSDGEDYCLSETKEGTKGIVLWP